MRKSFVESMQKELASNDSSVLILGDIGVHAFMTSFAEFPDRTFNIGILEQSMVSVAAGLALEGFIPTVHTIAPFVVERALEQIKIDFGYQRLAGNVVSVGASVDYAALGSTHHCPGDVGLLLNVPEIQIVVPGNGREFASLFSQSSRNGSLTYTRLSESENESTQDVEFGKANLVKSGSAATVLCIGPTLDITMEACKDLDVNVIYFTTVYPFDLNLLALVCTNGKLLLVEPFYRHTVTSLIVEHLGGKGFKIDSVGVPRHFLRNYGSAQEHYEEIGLSSPEIRRSILELINA